MLVYRTCATHSLRGHARARAGPRAARSGPILTRVEVAVDSPGTNRMPFSRNTRAAPSVLDEIHGARAVGALLAGDRDGAAHALEPASNRYLVGFFCRLALLAPSVAMRLAYRVVRRPRPARLTVNAPIRRPRRPRPRHACIGMRDENVAQARSRAPARLCT